MAIVLNEVNRGKTPNGFGGLVLEPWAALHEGKRVRPVYRPRDIGNFIREVRAKFALLADETEFIGLEVDTEDVPGLPWRLRKAEATKGI